MDEVSNKTKPKHIEKALEELPQGLNDNYDRTIERIKSQGSDCWDLARKVLLWLSNALEPLSVGALQEAVAVESGMTGIGIRDLDDIESLISACAGLVVFEGGKETSAPRLVHYTLQEYLNKNQAILSPNPHAVVARACLAFSSFDDFSNKSSECLLRQPLFYRLPVTRIVLYNPYHFTCYAALSWGFHAQRAVETESIDAALDFLSRPFNVAYNWHVLMNKDLQWLQMYLKPLTYEDLLKDADFFRMLLAAHFRLKDVLVELLKRRTRPAENALDPVISDLACHAARLGYKEIVRLLLNKKDVDWNMCGFDDRNLLLLVVGWDEEETLRILLQKESCSVNALTDSGSALHCAGRTGHTSIARIFLEARAEVEARRKDCWSVISEAVPCLPGDVFLKEMMDLLLEYKADINAPSRKGDTVLHIAAALSQDSTLAVEYLVLKGANVNLLNRQGKTPLDLAKNHAEREAPADPEPRMPIEFQNFKKCQKEVAVKIVQILREAGGRTATELSLLSSGPAAQE